MGSLAEAVVLLAWNPLLKGGEAVEEGPALVSEGIIWTRGVPSEGYSDGSDTSRSAVIGGSLSKRMFVCKEKNELFISE